ncbi:hypothetical protein MHU86_432 [Fragilaria crotonensis]|nr:hypothetical protein MHU86_432 [Fragilaria crotonensis]
MVGIAGLLAKRKQAAVTTQELQNNSSTPSNDDLDINIELNDPFSFEERPSTSCSFEFSGSYMEANSFDNYNGADADRRGGSEVDGRDFGEIVAAPTAVVTPAQEKDMEMLSMPPPPPRSIPASDQPETQNEHIRAPDRVVIVSDCDPPEDITQDDADNATRDGSMEGFVMTDDIPNQSSAEVGDFQCNPPSPALPSRVTDTHAQTIISPTVASLRPYGSPTASEYTSQTHLPAVTPPVHELTLPCGASAVRTCDVSTVTPQLHDDHITGQDEGFDDMQVRLLHDLQVVKDKHLESEEQMLEMEVSLEHVIASINRQILQMQEMHDELDEVEDVQEDIVAMHRE